MLLAVWPGAAQPAGKAPPDVEEALKTRALQFYKLLEEGKFRQAESLVAEQSRDLFYAMSKARVRDAQFQSVAFSDDFHSADVVVLCVLITPRMAGLDLHVPTPSKWKLIDGQWYLLIKPVTTTPFGPMRWDDPSKSPTTAQLPTERPTLESIVTGSYEVTPQALTFPRDQGLVSRTVMVRNNLPGAIQVEVENPNLPGLGVVVPSKVVPAKGQAEFRLNYNPETGKLIGAKDLILVLQPLGQIARVKLTFE